MAMEEANQLLELAKMFGGVGGGFLSVGFSLYVLVKIFRKDSNYAAQDEKQLKFYDMLHKELEACLEDKKLLIEKTEKTNDEKNLLVRTVAETEGKLIAAIHENVTLQKEIDRLNKEAEET